jgi:hypothetical protein
MGGLSIIGMPELLPTLQPLQPLQLLSSIMSQAGGYSLALNVTIPVCTGRGIHRCFGGNSAMSHQVHLTSITS